MRMFWVIVGAAVFAGPAMAATQTVVLSAPAISCTGCSMRIKAALAKIKGVNQAQVVLEKRQVVVSFDDTQTSAPALTKAIAEAGFPSAVVK